MPGRLEKTTRSSPHHVAQHRPTGSETTPPYAPQSSRFGSEPPSVEDDVDVWRYVIVSCRPETTTTITVTVRYLDVVEDNVNLYSTFIVMHPKGAQAWITQLYLQTAPYLPPPHKHSPDGTTTDCGCSHLFAAYYLCIGPESMKGGVGLVGDL